MRLAMAATVLLAGCAQRALQVPFVDSDRSLVVLAERPGGPSADACDVDHDCDQLLLGQDAWQVLVLVYPQSLSELDLMSGPAMVLAADAPGAATYPPTERAFAAEDGDSELTQLSAGQSPLYRRIQRDPTAGCARWTIRWSAAAGAAELIPSTLQLDEDLLIAFGDDGGRYGITPDSTEPMPMGAGPRIVASTKGGDGLFYALGADRRFYWVARDGALASLPIPELPVTSSVTKVRIDLAVHDPTAIYVQIVPGRTSTVPTSLWAFDGAWSQPYTFVTPQNRVNRLYTSQGLALGPGNIVYSTEFPSAALVALDGPAVVPVLGLDEVEETVQIRRLDQDRLLAVSRYEREGRLQVGAFDGRGQITWAPTTHLPRSDQWVCSESKMGLFLCVSDDTFLVLTGTREACEAAAPAAPKNTQHINPLGSGWLIRTADPRRSARQSLNFLAPK